jgi:signal transduction histidine kinase
MLPEDSDAALKSLLGIATRSTERIQRLTSSLLDIRRLEAGKPIGNCVAVRTIELAQDAIDAVAATAQTKHQELDNKVPADLPSLLVDADMIRRVLINLLENAVKYTPQAGKFYIAARQEEDWVQIWVQDNGPGIPESDQDRIFEKFTRLNSKDSPRGLGLGLAYCRLAVEGHGGRIWVESQPGEGSRFTLTLPINKG